MDYLTNHSAISRRTISEDVGKSIKIRCEVSKKLLLDENKKQTGIIICIRHDITDKKVIEQELRAKDKSLSKAQNIAHVGSWDWDIVNDDIFWSNETYRIYGKNPVCFIPIYQKILSILNPDDKDRIDSHIQNLITGDADAIDTEHRLLQDSGTTRYVYEVARIYRDSNNIEKRVIGVTHDITDRKLPKQRKMISLPWLAMSYGHLSMAY